MNSLKVHDDVHVVVMPYTYLKNSQAITEAVAASSM